MADDMSVAERASERASERSQRYGTIVVVGGGCYGSYYVRQLRRAPETPWQRATPDGPHYVSFAVWICPINCIEPQTCPHTRELRTWSLPSAARAYVEEEQRGGGLLVGPVIFHCTHRAYGVG